VDAFAQERGTSTASYELERLLEIQLGQVNRNVNPDNPVFILCTARSGSTLLRTILDGHPAIVSPAETALPTAIQSLGMTWVECERLVPGGSKLSPAAKRSIRSAVSKPFEVIARNQGKRIWCDKTLINATYANLIHDIFPNGRFLCLYRNCMDMVYSGIQASPWGFDAFGFDPFIRSTPSNFVKGVAEYWHTTTSAIRSFQESHPGQSHAVYYEALIAEPESTLKSVLDFLGLPWSDEMLKLGGITRMTSGQADHKISFTNGIRTESVGEGHKVPIKQVPPRLLEALNDLLRNLGYPVISPDWNKVMSPLRKWDGVKEHGWDDPYLTVLELIPKGLARANTDLQPSEEDFVRLGLVFEDGSDDPPGLVFDLTGDDADGTTKKPELLVIGTAGTFLRIANDELNFGEASKRGEVRIERADMGVALEKNALPTLRYLQHVLVTGSRRI
jgi:hypothetical protein